MDILDNYLEFVFKDYEIDINKDIAFFDYFSTSQTYDHITDSLKRLYGNSLKFNKVDVIFRCESGYCGMDESSQYDMMVEGEHMNKRCIPSYYLLDGKRIKVINKLRCNVVIALVVLAKLDMLHHSSNEYSHKYGRTYARKLPKIIIPRLEEGKYNATYYDIETYSIITGPIRLFHNKFTTGKYKNNDHKKHLLNCIISVNYSI